MAELKYLPAGIRLHIQEIFYKLTDNLKEYYYFNFASIPDGLKAEKILKSKIECKVIPVPDDIFKDCGVAILVSDTKKAKSILKENNIEFEIYKYENNKPIKIEGNLTNLSCRR